jgi:hypothetical protein
MDLHRFTRGVHYAARNGASVLDAKLFGEWFADDVARTAEFLSWSVKEAWEAYNHEV